MLGLYPFASTNIDSLGNSFYWRSHTETGTSTDSSNIIGSIYVANADVTATMTISLVSNPQFIDYLEDVSITATEVVALGASNYLASLGESGAVSETLDGNVLFSTFSVSDSLTAADGQVVEGSQIPLSIDITMSPSEAIDGVFLLNRDVIDTDTAQDILTNVMTMPMNVTDINTAQAPITGNLTIPVAASGTVTVSTSWAGRNLWEAIDTGPHSGWVLVNTQ